MDQNPEASSATSQGSPSVSSPLLTIILGLAFFAILGIILFISAYIFSNKDGNADTVTEKKETAQELEDSTETIETTEQTDTTIDEDMSTLDTTAEEINSALEEINNALVDLDASLEETDTPPTF